MSRRQVSSTLLILGLALGCGASVDEAGGSADAAPSVTVSPGSAALGFAGTQRFAAAVVGTADTRVTWTIREGSPGGGTVAADGSYTAPGAPGTFHVVATSVAQTGLSASATVTVSAAPSVTVKVSPQAITLTAGAARDFTCTVTGSADTACTWSVTEAGGGTIDPGTGHYLAPQAPGTYHVVAASHASAAKTDQATITVIPACVAAGLLGYAITRPATPALYYHDLTLKVFVGAATTVSVTDDGSPVPSTLDGLGWVVFTAAGSAVEVCAADGVPATPGYGNVAKAPLKYDRKWAWSIGMDDNVNLSTLISGMQARGVRGTTFLIGNTVADTSETWRITYTDIRNLVAAGWAIGNHYWDNGSTNTAANIVQCSSLLQSIIDGSSVPTRRVLSFANPNFDSAYNATFNQVRTAGTTELLFNESGNEYLVDVDTSGAVASGAVRWTPTMVVGRSTTIYSSFSGTTRPLLDGIAAQAAAGHHLWFNFLSHGGASDATSALQVIDYITANFGPSVWNAPSDEVYSYLVTRDGAVVTRQ